MSRLALLIDGALGLSVLFLLPWLYELANWISLTAVGAHPSLMWSGILPTGVMTSSSVHFGFPEAKLLQIGICTGPTLAACFIAKKEGLKVTTLALVASSGLFLASAYWELLSVTTTTSPLVHETVFYALGTLVTLGLLRVFPESERIMASPVR